jgi:phage gp46-like protein
VADVYLYHTADGGEIDYVVGKAVMSDGLETAAYLSLFGGNEDDASTDPDDPGQWWGNFGESEERKLRSRTGHLLTSLVAIPANLRTVEDAARQDLAWMLAAFAESVDARATMPAPRRIELKVYIVVDGTGYNFTFGETWTAQ